MTEHLDDHSFYGDHVRRYRLGETPAPNHEICRPVCALVITSAAMMGEGYVNALTPDGEPVMVDVPLGFARQSTPVPGDMVIIDPTGSVTHRPAALFAAESRPIQRLVMPGCDGPDFCASGSVAIVRRSGEVATIPLMHAFPAA
ncbi:hypothetical protein [Methylobacterium sp. Leaf108]|uniref:hypothetical protein n=1 Tax=Methylobacterium sp. Leaf108 TaxID=1736256 RepID=UPI0006FCA557|nr:hypothetical protein [Methylobacterium sp. Leaf108]KQP61082.1 hypothetical protein ASF39_15535 [Methylobacterium sp. Leaf108]